MDTRVPSGVRLGGLAGSTPQEAAVPPTAAPRAERGPESPGTPGNAADALFTRAREEPTDLALRLDFQIESRD